MDKVAFGDTDLKVSKVALGGIPLMRLSKGDGVKLIRDVLNMGINFIDTANVYGDSEEKIGEAIKIFKRDNLVLSSKSLATDKKTFMLHLDLSLKRLNTDYIDIYHIHGVNSGKKAEKILDDEGAYQGLKEAVSSGKIRYTAFSSHNSRIAKKLMVSKKFHSVQIPFNFVDTQTEELVTLADKLNLGFIAMKPMGGGLLEDANLAFRYLAQFKKIIPDPGIEKAEEMAEIVEIIKNPRLLTLEEKEAINKIRRELGETYCHRCDYCQPCPNNIPISAVMITKSIIKRMPFGEAKDLLDDAIEKAKNCTECKKCIKKCPYNLKIPTFLKEYISLWEDYKKDFLGPGVH